MTRARDGASAPRTSPVYVRVSQAAALMMGFVKGRFYRGAKLYCINLLLTYPEGCSARCAYCGLSGHRKIPDGKKNFIRVDWPTYPIDEVIEAMKKLGPNLARRVCISQVTHARSAQDTLALIERIHGAIPDLPISLLVTPTLLDREALQRFKDAGAERIGIAVDLARSDLFDQFRGKAHKGPHRWEKYWSLFEEAVAVYGEKMVGCHLMVGMGETEQEMVEALAKVSSLGGVTHLFSFFPEKGSELEDRPQPPVGQYRRMQLARYLIDNGLADPAGFAFDEAGRLTSFGLSDDALDDVIDRGTPFCTSGCPSKTGDLGCNRPYGDSPPGDDIRSFPFVPDAQDLTKIRRELASYV